jgi:hypothetical protein
MAAKPFRPLQPAITMSIQTVAFTLITVGFGTAGKSRISTSALAAAVVAGLFAVALFVAHWIIRPAKDPDHRTPESPGMRKRSLRNILISLIAFVVLATLSAIIAISMVSDDIDRITYGMSREQVHAIIGPPLLANQPKPSVVWGVERRIVDLWNREDKGIAVGYDDDGNVNYIDRFGYGMIESAIRRFKHWLSL